MLAWMNADALRAHPGRTGEARLLEPLAAGELWKQGRDLRPGAKDVVELRVDCDQDAVWLKVLPQGDGGACHVGFRSCFYRIAERGADGAVSLIERP